MARQQCLLGCLCSALTWPGAGHVRALHRHHTAVKLLPLQPWIAQMRGTERYGWQRLPGEPMLA